MPYILTKQPERPNCVVCGQPAAEQSLKSKHGFTMYKKVCSRHNSNDIRGVNASQYKKLCALVLDALKSGITFEHLEKKIKNAIRSYKNGQA